ncbi:Protein of unknown function [Gryllus bimaculatus]|nr:Protein of unknown function [Gryllus bimaculatus]
MRGRVTQSGGRALAISTERKVTGPHNHPTYMSTEEEDIYYVNFLMYSVFIVYYSVISLYFFAIAAGDFVKFGFTMASTTTLLAWGMLSYRDAYKVSDIT